MLILKKYVLLHSLTTIELIDLFKLFNGVMVAQQILVLLVQVRALVEQQKPVIRKIDRLYCLQAHLFVSEPFYHLFNTGFFPIH